MKRVLTFGYSPSTMGRTSIQKIARPISACSEPANGTLFSTRQATTQAWQPVHLSRSITIPQRGISSPLRLGEPHPRRVLGDKSGQAVALLAKDLVGVCPSPLRPSAIGLMPLAHRHVHDVGHRPRVESSLGLEFAKWRLHPDPVAIGDPELLGYLRVDLDPRVPFQADRNVGNLLKMRLAGAPASGGGRRLEGVKMEREVLLLTNEPGRLVMGEEGHVPPCGHPQLLEQFVHRLSGRRAHQGPPQVLGVELEPPGSGLEESATAAEVVGRFPPSAALDKRLPELVEGLVGGEAPPPLPQSFSLHFF